MPSAEKTPVYLCLGSNLGDKKGNLETILRLLPPLVKVLQTSSIYRTEPWGYSDQPDFLNQIVLAETDLAPLELLAYLKEIEKQIGRRPNFTNGPRVADIDIILFGDRIVETDVLQIPHPRFQQRAFVLVPLAEIAPDLRVPGSDQTVTELLVDLEHDGVELYRDHQL